MPYARNAEEAMLVVEHAADAALRPCLCALVLVVALWAAVSFIVKTRPARKIRRLAAGTRPLTPEEFFRLRNGRDGRGRTEVLAADFPGVYVIENEDDGRCYVGQGVRTMGRVNQHFTGKGNGDVYADYVQGRRFRIRLIALKGSGYRDLDSLERDAIAAYGAYEEGYNKTRGNRPA